MHTLQTKVILQVLFKLFFKVTYLSTFLESSTMVLDNCIRHSAGDYRIGEKLRSYKKRQLLGKF
jgi:hypothetical protein